MMDRQTMIFLGSMIAAPVVLLNAPLALTYGVNKLAAQITSPISSQEQLEELLSEHRRNLEIDETYNIEVIFDESGTQAMAEKLGEDHYRITLVPGEDSPFVFEHEIAHIGLGHCDRMYEEGSLGIYDQLFTAEIPATLYALTGARF